MIIRKTTLAVIFGISSLCVNAQTVAPDNTGMDIDAREWTKGVSMGWNLGNSLESAGAAWDDATGTWNNAWIKDYNQWETAWGNPKTTRDMIKAVKAAGFDAIRVPVRWVPHITDYSTMTVDPVWMARVKEVVDWCLDEGFTVIINTHHELWLERHAFYKEQTELQRKLKALWTNIATEFRDYDSRLAFAGTNEVTDDWKTPTAENLAVQNGYNQDFIDAVRATGGRNYYRQLIVQTYACDPNYGLSGFVIPKDKVEGRLSVEFHYYSPYSYCSGAEGCYYYWGEAFADKGSITPDGNERGLSNLFTQIRKAWFEKGLGVVVGEYGVARHYSDEAHRDVQDDNARYYLECVASESRKNGFAAFVWDNNAFGNGSEKFGIFNRNNGMSVDTPHFLNGITAGSKTEFSEEIIEEGQEDAGKGGREIWNGSKQLGWGDAIKLPASVFSNATTSATLVLYYEPIATAEYTDIQFCYSNWSKINLKVGETSIEGDFNPRGYYGVNSGSFITPFAFDATSLTLLKNSGIIIQGYGVKVSKIVILDASTGIATTVMSTGKIMQAYTIGGIKLQADQYTDTMPYGKGDCIIVADPKGHTRWWKKVSAR